MDIERLDENMKPVTGVQDGITWHSPCMAPFQLEGFPWYSTDRLFRRLPKHPRWPISENVDILANYTAGGMIRFRTDARQLKVRVFLSGAADMNHMPATGQCGFDCYIGAPGSMRFCAASKYNHSQKDYEVLLFDLEPGMRDITLHFPLYMGVSAVYIGLSENAEVLPPGAFRLSSPVVFYGTSITQGGCASRPGMAYTNILSRRLGIPCINLGFSGNGRGEPALATLIADISPLSAIVLDYEANAGEDGLQATLGSFVRLLRVQHPQVPILLVSRIPYATDSLNPEQHARRLRQRDFQQDFVETLRKSGDSHLHFLDGSTLLGADADECTVDGVHPTDLGFLRMAESMAPVLEELLFSGECRT